MTQSLALKQIQKAITTHSEKFHASKNEKMSEIVQSIITNLSVRTNDVKDVVVALYLLNHDMTKQMGESLNGLRNETDQLAIATHADNLFEQQSINHHVENLLISLNLSESFGFLYKRDQYYHGFQRFAQAVMTISKGFNLMFSYVNEKGEFHHALVKVDDNVTVRDLFDAVIFGYFMENPKNKEEKDASVAYMLGHHNVDIITDTHAGEIKSTQPNFSTFSSTEILEKYHELAIQKVSVE
jgi:hypothetical protein